MQKYNEKLYNTLLASVMTISLITSLSSCIDEDMSDCGKDYKIQYNLQLNTQINTVIDVDLNLIEEQEIAARLKQALSKVFTDHAHDNDLSFFVGEELSHHEANKMGANSVSYTIYLPRNNYQNLSLANTGSADNVKSSTQTPVDHSLCGKRQKIPSTVTTSDCSLPDSPSTRTISNTICKPRSIWQTAQLWWSSTRAGCSPQNSGDL